MSEADGDTTIGISRKNWRRLNAKKETPGESFDDALDRVLTAYEEDE